MKCRMNLTGFALIGAVCMMTGSAFAASSYSNMHGVKVKKSYTEDKITWDKMRRGTKDTDDLLYVTVNAGTNMWSFKNQYKSDEPGVVNAYDEDKYSFKPVFAGSVSVGKKFNMGVRGEVELGTSSPFTDSGDGMKLSMMVPYLMANVYYDFDSGFYAGGGLGISTPIVKIEGNELFRIDSKYKGEVSPKVGLALGYVTNIFDGIYLDFRYRLSGIQGLNESYSYSYDLDANGIADDFNGDGIGDMYTLKVENDWIYENAFSVGLRFVF